MATVRITDTLKNEIDHKIRGQFAVRRAPLEQQLRAMFDAADPKLTDAIAGTLRDMLDVSEAALEAAKPFVQYADRVRVNTLNNVAVPYRHQNIQLAKAIPYPTANSTVYMGAHTGFSDLVSPRLAEWATRLSRITDEMAALDAEEQKFREQIKTLLQRCSTYRQAVDIWPQLTAVTPQEYLDRHNAQSTRMKPEAPSVNLDMDALNLTAVRNRVAGATTGGTT